MASKALLMSIVMSSVLFAGLRELMPSCVCCVMFVRSVVVEWSGLYPCCIGESGMKGVVTVRMRRSMTLDGVQSNVIVCRRPHL